MLCTDSCVCIDEEQLNLMSVAEDTPPTGPVELTDADLEQVVGGRGACSQSTCTSTCGGDIVCC